MFSCLILERPLLRKSFLVYFHEECDALCHICCHFYLRPHFNIVSEKGVEKSSLIFFFFFQFCSSKNEAVESPNDSYNSIDGAVALEDSPAKEIEPAWPSGAKKVHLNDSSFGEFKKSTKN